MKTKSIYTLIIVAILSITNISIGHSENTTKTYKNVTENKDERSKTVSLYEGINDLYLKPTQQYTIKFSPEGSPTEKIHYQWNIKNKSWTITEKYNYIYDNNGKVQTMTHSMWNEATKTWNENTEFAIYQLDINSELLTLNNL